jgi:hypothetical protein
VNKSVFPFVNAMVLNLGNTLFLCVPGQRLFDNWRDLFMSGTDFGFRGVRMFLL